MEDSQLMPADHANGLHRCHSSFSNPGDNGIGRARLFQGPGDGSGFPGLDQRDHVAPASPAGQFRSQRAGLAGCFD